MYICLVKSIFKTSPKTPVLNMAFSGSFGKHEASGLYNPLRVSYMYCSLLITVMVPGQLN